MTIGRLDGFVTGFNRGLEAGGQSSNDDFFLWLRDEAGAWPQEGWARAYLKQADGDHRRGIEVLFDHLHRFLLETRPAWFVRFNQDPQPSMFSNGLGTPADADVRRAEHVREVTGQPPVELPNIKLSAFQLGDGYVQFLGLPADVGRWWNGRGYRVAFLPTGSEAGSRLKAARGSREQLKKLVAGELGGCAIDASLDRVTVVARGGCGAVLVRERRLHAVASRTLNSVDWTVKPGDRILILTGALLQHAARLGGKALPAKLATAEPVAWAQMIDTPERRLCVAIEWPRERVELGSKPPKKTRVTARKGIPKPG